MNNSASQAPAHDLEERPFSATLETADVPAPAAATQAATLPLFPLRSPTPAVAAVFLIFLHQDQSLWIRFLKMLSLNFEQAGADGEGPRTWSQEPVPAASPLTDVSSPLEGKRDLAQYQMVEHPSGSL